MVVFNECRIDKEGKNIILDVSVDSLSYYKNMYLDSVIIDTDKTFIDCGPSSTPIYNQKFPNVNGEKPKNIRVKINHSELSDSNIDLNNCILFIYIKVGGVPDINTPCGCDKTYSIAVAVNLRPIYNIAMRYIKELDNNCTIPKGFIDMILRLKAFEMSIKTGNFTTAINQWNKLFKNKRTVSSSNCGCNGTS